MKSKFFRRFKRHTEEKRMMAILMSVGVLVLASVLVTLVFSKSEKKTFLEKVPSKKEEPLLPHRAIDGLRVEKDERPLPLAVIIDNHPDAYPLSGIGEANLVWETPVEGGLTRFLAIFGDGADIKKIGPVRSARPYFLNWAAEFGAPLAHVGGSPEALSRIRIEQIFTIDEFRRAATFWREKERVAPHSTYTSTELLKKETNKRLSETLAIFEPWLFTDSWRDLSLPLAAAITIPFSSDYKVVWTYDKESGRYLRMRGAVPERDADGKLIEAVNVAILFTNIKVLDDVGRRKIETLGTGNSMVFSEGFLARGTWRKDGSELRTRFYNERAQEISFRPGVTWIEVVPKWTEVEFKN